MPALPLNDIPAGVDVVLDANVLVYALAGMSAQSHELLKRCDTEEVSGYTTAEIVSDVTHRLMLAEARARGLIPRASASVLSGRPHVVRQLRTYTSQVQRLLDSNLLILELDVRRLHAAQRLRDNHGLLTTDSLVLAAALELGIEHLATNDADFDDVPVITVYRPTDLPRQ